MPRLRAVKPTAVQKRLKMFLFGPAGVGKTTAGIQFPSPYLIDTEKGAENAQYVAALDAAGGVYFHTTDLNEIIEEVRALLTESHPYRTLIIDPVSVPYNNAVDQSARELARKAGGDSDGTEFGRHKMNPDRAMKRLMALVTQLDMNVIMTAHAKGKWEKVGDKIEQVGQTFDAYNKVDYLFDLVVEVRPRGRDERVGFVHKSRIEAFPVGEVFPFNYQTIAGLYGHEILERRAGTMELATAEQVARIRHLVEVCKIDQDIIDKWFAKANTDNFEEFPKDAAAKVIEWLDKQLTTPAAA